MAARTVQVHLDRLCNLACLHCYSRSGPSESERLPVDTIVGFLSDARDQGYTLVAFSGGEPFLYPDFEAAIAAARRVGLRAIAVTNGTVLTGRRLAALSALDLVAVSVDGPEGVHNRLRGSATAFSRMLRGLEAVRAAAIPFGIIHTVTRESLPHLPWMAAFARDAGATLLQLHPLGIVGGAADSGLDALDGETLARAYLAALALREEYGDSLHIHVDLFNRHQLVDAPSLVVPPEEVAAGTALADVINPLVLRSDGIVSPICHALGDRFAVADLAHERLADAAADFLRADLPRLHRFTSSVYDEVAGGAADAWPYLNWYELLEAEAVADASPRRPEPLAALAAT